MTKLEGIKAVFLCMAVLLLSLVTCAHQYPNNLCPSTSPDCSWLPQQTSTNQTTPLLTLQQAMAYSYNFLAQQSIWIEMGVLLTSLLTALQLWHLFTRWHFPILYAGILDSAKRNQYIRYLGSAFFILMGYYFMSEERPNTMHASSSAHCSTAAMFSFVLGLLWQYAGPYYINRRYALATSALVPACLVQAGVWMSTPAPSFVLTSDWGFNDRFLCCLMVVCISGLLDNADALLHTYPQVASRGNTKCMALMQSPFSWTYWRCMFGLINDVLPQQHELNPDPVLDLVQVIRGLGPASRSWKTMAALFPSPLRQELCILYGFFRACDDLVDDAPTLAQRHQNLQLIRAYMRLLFTMCDSGKLASCTPPSSVQDLFHQQKLQDATLAHHPHVDWSSLWEQLDKNPTAFSSFRALARISDHLCPKAADDLCKAWKIDLLGRPLNTEQDLLAYAALISGKFGELCTCVIMYKTGRGNWNGSDLQARNDKVVSQARATGQCLQLVNIARDILRDSLDGRCYVPMSYLMNNKQTFDYLRRGKPERVGNDCIRSHAVRILDLADQISGFAQLGIDGLPEEVQDGIRAAFDIYMAIGPIIRQELVFPMRAKVPSWKKQWIAFKYIYGLAGISTAFNEAATMVFGKKKGAELM
ncbi:terpenoid synthase [Hesseltinella vesiculosa]|uniref:15-cis-phytoene synthase n=1 Tax=Hesseltinella vesiculosa TaxID=101127 RepID=A0A1X2G7C8_9FUNG|nr:terpenoid synthase [Hesseltinella vesiculosa]